MYPTEHGNHQALEASRRPLSNLLAQHKLKVNAAIALAASPIAADPEASLR
jgi:hypothetical protein